MNPILEIIVEDRNGFYLHALEVSNVYELENAIDVIYDEYSEDYSNDIIIDFFDTMELYCLEEENSESVYNFNISDYINNL